MQTSSRGRDRPPSELVVRLRIWVDVIILRSGFKSLPKTEVVETS